MIVKVAMLCLYVFGVYCESIKDVALKTHNELRSKENVGLPPLKWDDDLAASATAYAEQCILDYNSTDGVGQNLAIYLSVFLPITNPNQYVRGLIIYWVEREKRYRNETWFCCSLLHRFCCQYKQVVWKDSTYLGCGYANCPRRGLFLVCQYKPGAEIPQLVFHTYFATDLTR